MPQGIDDKGIESSEFATFGLVYRQHIGNIGKCPHTIPHNGQPVMPHSQGHHFGAEKRERGKIADLMQRQMGDSRLGTIGKTVSKPVMNHLQYPGSAYTGMGICLVKFRNSSSPDMWS